MAKIKLNNKEYDIDINIGVLEDLEDKGHSLATIASGNGFSVKFIVDLLEITTGEPRSLLRKIPLTELSKVSDILNNAFEGDGSGE